MDTIWTVGGVPDRANDDFGRPDSRRFITFDRLLSMAARALFRNIRKEPRIMLLPPQPTKPCDFLASEIMVACFLIVLDTPLTGSSL